MLELSTVAVDILVDQRAIAASNLLVRGTSTIRAVKAEGSKVDSAERLRMGFVARVEPNLHATIRHRSA